MSQPCHCHVLKKKKKIPKRVTRIVWDFIFGLIFVPSLSWLKSSWSSVVLGKRKKVSRKTMVLARKGLWL